MPERKNTPKHQEPASGPRLSTPRPLPKLRNGLKRPGRVERELCQWYALTDSDRRASLRKAAMTGTGYSCETLVHFCQHANSTGDQELLDWSFEALCGTATKIILGEIRARTRADRDDLMQDVFVSTLHAILNGQADFAECNFRAFVRRRSVDAYRKVSRTYESRCHRIEPTDELDPLDGIAYEGLDPAKRAMLELALQRLPEKHRRALIQHFILGLTQKEIAERHGVSDRTVRTWLKKATKP